MGDIWESLTEEQKQDIRSNTRALNENEISNLFARQDNGVVFRILRKTDRALAGSLDIDILEEGSEFRGQTGSEDIGCEDNISPEQAMAEELDGYESVEIHLISPEDFDYEPEITDADEEAAKPIDEELSQFSDYYTQDEISTDESVVVEDEEVELPPVVDHRPNQSPIKNQGRRGTCVAHASLGLLESYDHIPGDLSEQHAHYKFNEFLNRPHNLNSGLRTTDAARFLAHPDGRVCEESDWPYIPDQNTINQMVQNGSYNPPEGCKDKAVYGYGTEAYKIITDRGLNGESIKNPRYLESLLHKGYNIVIGTWVSWDDKDNNGILDPVLDSKGNPIGMGGHAMLVVGYNRPSECFIVKNSWGRGWGHGGYAYLHYNLVRSCFKYGFVVDKVVPEAATQLSRKLSQAPYETERIPRENLRAAILFMKTSRGRYAVCEAYAGDNLLLRNLRVYNPNGSLHLERDSLLIRGTYLLDIDSARETSVDADFWWQAVRPGNNYLVPRNKAAACVAFDLAALSAQEIGSITPGSTSIEDDDLNYAVIVGRTTSRRCFKMLVHAKPGNQLQISYLELFQTNGNRYFHITDLRIQPSCTYNLDTLQASSGRYDDIRWHVICDGTGSLETCSNASMELLWRL
jgi:C1A family cysteine protease